MDTLGTYLGNVHATVLRQHAEIRARLRGLDAGQAPSSAPLSAVYLRVSLFRLAVIFESHLLFEELELAPRIRAVDAWGPAREAAMMIEHAEQRARIERACCAAESELAGDDMELAREVSSLVVSLLEDMAREELELCELELLGGGGVLDQTTG